MRTIGLATWMADSGRHMVRRMTHLLGKEDVDKWVWIVRPTNDNTVNMLRMYEQQHPDRVCVLLEDWHPNEDRIVGLSCLGDHGINKALQMGAERLLIHESDLLTPINVVSLLRETRAACVGGWPILAGGKLPPFLLLTPDATLLEEPIFYDTWGYRAGGVRFKNSAPYHEVYQPRPFRLDSVGSVALIDCEYLRGGARFFPGAFVTLCESIRGLGGEVWCDPRVPVVQPVELWNFNDN